MELHFGGITNWWDYILVGLQLDELYVDGIGLIYDCWAIVVGNHPVEGLYLDRDIP